MQLFASVKESAKKKRILPEKILSHLRSCVLCSDVRLTIYLIIVGYSDGFT